jgi:hypothetical protein
MHVLEVTEPEKGILISLEAENKIKLKIGSMVYKTEIHKVTSESTINKVNVLTFRKYINGYMIF